MKKILLGALLIATSCFTGAISPVFADESYIKSEIVSFVDNQHQINLSNLNKFAINNSNIFYLNDNLNLYNMTNKVSSELNYENVTDLKQTQNYVVLKTNNTLKILKNNNEIIIDGLNITCEIYNIYESDALYISYINNKTLNFLKINFENQIEIQRNVQINELTVVAVCLNENYTYVITKNTSNFGLIKYSNLINSNTPLSFNYLNCSAIETFNQNNETYFLITVSLNQTLVLLKEENNNLTTIAQKTTRGTSNPSFIKNEIYDFTDVKYYNNLIYVADKVNKNIQSFEIKDNEIVAKDVVLASASYEKGYFYGVNDFKIINENSFLISDTLNNRIQKISENEIELITSYNNTNLIFPKYITTNNNLDFWFYSSNKIIQLSENVAKEYVVGNSISALEVDTKNNVYFLNYENRTIQTINSTGNSIQTLQNLPNINSTSKLQLLNNGEIVITHNNIITKYNSSFEEITVLNMNENVLDITADYYNNLYVLTNLGINKVDNMGETLVKAETLNYDSSNFSTIEINKVDGTIYGFDSKNCCFIKLTNKDFTTNLFEFEHVVDVENIEPYEQIITSGVVLKNCYLSSYPHNTDIGLSLNKDVKVFILGEVENSYYVMFNENNTINYGYISKEFVQPTKYEINEPTKVVVINKNIKLYTLPTILHDENNSFAYKTVQLNTKLDIVNFNLNSLDNSEYYAVKTTDNKILYVNSSDVTVYGSEDIKPLPDLNAEIITADNKKIKLLSSTNEEANVIMELSNGQKIYVENFSTANKYTYITIITEDKQEIFGYVETKYIKLINNNPNLISAYVLLGIAILIIIATIIIFCIHKKNDLNLN